MTRTIWYGHLCDRDRHLLLNVRLAQQRGVAAVAAGVKACEVDDAARQSLKAADLDLYFVHSVGHGIGLEVHELPTLRSTSQQPLEAGQVITVEPGAYLPEETGCRVEDTVVVTAQGCQVLNRFPKQPIDSERPIMLP